MKHICVVTGASSQIGDALLTMLPARFSQVVAWSRQPQSQSSVVDWQPVDLTEAQAIDESISHLIHLAPLPFLAALLETAPQPLRVVAISTCSARHKALSASAAERRLAQAFVAAEEQAVAIAKLRGHQLTILRPTMLYGVGRDGTVAVLQRFAMRFGFLLVPGSASGLRQPVHVSDVASAVMGCLAVDETAGKLYELGGQNRMTLRQMCEQVLVDNGKRPRVLSIPLWPLRLAIHLLRILKIRPEWDAALLLRASQDQTVDNGPAQWDFGYEPQPFNAKISARGRIR